MLLLYTYAGTITYLFGYVIVGDDRAVCAAGRQPVERPRARGERHRTAFPEGVL